MGVEEIDKEKPHTPRPFTTPPCPFGRILSVPAEPVRSVIAAVLEPAAALRFALGLIGFAQVSVPDLVQIRVCSSLPDQHIALSFPFSPCPSSLDPRTCRRLARHQALSVTTSFQFLSLSIAGDLCGSASCGSIWKRSKGRKLQQERFAPEY